jgi:hypothetical protein
MTNNLFRKDLVLVIIVCFVGASVFPNICGNVQVKDEYRNLNSEELITIDDFLDQENGDVPHHNFYGVLFPHLMAQSFKPTFNTLTRVELGIRRSVGHTGDLIVSIRDSKNGDNLTSITIPVTSIPFVHLGTWVIFDFPNITVTPEEEYYIMWMQTSEEFGTGWGIDQDANYPRGQMWVVWSNGTWVSMHFNDMVFRTYGYNHEGPIIEIEDVNGGFRTSSIITNTGIGTAYDVEWSIDLDGGFLLAGRHSEGVIEELAGGESKTVSQKSLFGIGSVAITVNADDVTESASGFVLGPLVLGVG